ncbi:MAG: hypothetical protein WBD12_02170 [Candidatus Omnitrophota bacterium]
MKNLHKMVRMSMIIVFVAGSVECAAAPEPSDLDALYTRTAGAYAPKSKYGKPQRNPVIVIPGLLGSRLIDPETDTVVWGAFSGRYADPSKKNGARLAALPMQEGVPLKDLKDSVVPGGALARLDLKLFVIPIRLNAYYNILKILGVGGYRDEDIGKSGTVKYPEGHFTSFQFDYDWRRDIVENAKLLDKFIEEHKAYVQQEVEQRYGIKDYEVKFDIVAHSMGGLLARYYLRYGGEDLPENGAAPRTTWAGTKYVNKLVIISTPNAGSISSFKVLVEGLNNPMLPKYSPAILGTMPAMYELMPQARHKALIDKNAPDGEPLDIYDPALWEEMKWGLASPEQNKELEILLPDIKDPADRKRIALDHQRKCLARAKKFWEALDAAADPPNSVSFALFTGDAIDTDAVVGIDRKKGTFEVIRKAPGDGTVLRSSALMDERIGGTWTPKLISPIKWGQVMFIFSDHVGITKDPHFADNLLYYLLEHPD